nr:hypothetical protein [Tanacetum cinerariifolium]
DDFLEVELDAGNVYDDPFDSKEEKIKESKLLINELDLPCDFLSPFEYDSFISQDFSRVDALPSTSNEDKIFNPDFQKPDEEFSFLLWKEHSYLGCSTFPLLSPLINSSMGEFCQAERPKTSASWEAPHAYPIPGNVKTLAKGFYAQVFISSASIRESHTLQNTEDDV